MTTVSETLELAHKLSSNRLDQAKQVYQKVLETQPKQAEALYGLGILAQQAQQHQEAEKFFLAATQAQPGTVKAWFSLGNLYQTQGDLPKAEEAYKKALNIKPLLPIYNNLGYTLHQHKLATPRKNLQRKAMIISDLSYLYLIPETSAMNLNGGDAVATSTALAIASGLSTATKIDFKNLAISGPDFSFAASSVRTSSKSTGGSTFSFASSASASSPS